METEVFEQDAFAFLARRDFRLCVGTDDVGSESHFAAEQLVESLCDGREGEFFGLVLLCLIDDRLLCRRLLFRGKRFDFRLVFLREFHFVGEDGMGFAHVRAEDDFRAVLHQIFDGGQRADDTVFIGDRAVFHGHVEVTADENAFAFPILDVFYGHFVHSN